MTEMDRQLLVLGSAAVRAMLPMADAIALMRRAMTLALDPETRLPLRQATPVPGRPSHVLSIMPGALAEDAGLGAKVITVLPDNFERGLPSHQGGILLFDSATGRLLALLDAQEVTAIRTAAASGLATDLLARPDARILAICGYGEQAEQHIAAMRSVRPIAEVRVWGRSIERARAFVERVSADHDVQIRAIENLSDALDGSDIVCTTTASVDAWLTRAHLAPGMHVNLVGSSTAREREAADDVLVGTRIYVDYLPSTMAQAGEILPAIERGTITADAILGEIGDVLRGRVEGRQTADDITIYKSLGIAAQDLVVATHLFELSRSSGNGDWVAF